MGASEDGLRTVRRRTSGFWVGGRAITGMGIWGKEQILGKGRYLFWAHSGGGGTGREGAQPWEGAVGTLLG